jgi:type II secretory pathway pseudopilin PulG
VEILIVVIIVGILATLGISQFAAPREQAIEREGVVNLKLIAAAEKIYRLENNSNEYVNVADTAAANNVLKLALPISNSYWTYSVKNADRDGFEAVAHRPRPVAGHPIDMCINQSAEEPVKGTASCP